VKQTPDQVIAIYRAAYERAFPGKYLSLEHWRGWYTMYTGGMTQSKYRGADLIEMAANIEARLAAEEGK
jgi:hypothetical protein